MNKSLFIWFLLGITFIQCEKTPVEIVEEEEPVFYAQLKGFNIDQEYTAGVESYYMYTYHRTDNSDRLFLGGQLSQFPCEGSECPNSFSIEFLDGLASDFTGIETSNLNEDSIDYTNGLDTSFILGYNVNLLDESYGVNPNLNWSIAGNSGTVPSYSVFLPHNNDSIPNACLNIHDNGYQDDLCYPIHLRGNAEAYFTTTRNANIMQFNAAPNGDAPFSYEWDFGNGYVADSESPQNAITPGVATQQVCLRVTDADGDIAEYCKNVILDSSLVTCVANYRYLKTTSYQVNQDQFGTIILSYTDANGKIFSSDKFPQPPSSYFQVISSEKYPERDHNGHLTQKLHVKYSVWLYGDNGQDILIVQNSESVVALAYPG